MSIFVNQTQMFPYYQLGAAGCWSFNVWMGPSPVVALREACLAQDWDTAKQICLNLEATNRVALNIGNLSWRENIFKLWPATASPVRCARHGASFRRKSKTTEKNRGVLEVAVRKVPRDNQPGEKKRLALLFNAPRRSISIRGSGQNFCVAFRPL